MPPNERPVKQRSAARVLLQDEAGALLLFRDTDPGVPGSSWWTTPGGGIDPGETAEAAAVRELAEETGLVMTVDQIGSPIARRTVTHGYSDQITIQAEVFFRMTVPRFSVSMTGHTEEEQRTIVDHRWLSEADARASRLPVWPADAYELAAATIEGVLDLGEVEESTVPRELTSGGRRAGGARP